MNANIQKICCGDTKFCGECVLNMTTDSSAKSTVKSMTLNALGRCDMYSGPHKHVVDMSAQKAA